MYKKLIKIIVLIWLVFFGYSASAQTNRHYQIDLNWTETGLRTLGIAIIPGQAPNPFADDSLHRAVLKDFDSRTLETVYFSPSYTLIIEGEELGGEGGSIEEIQPDIVTLRIPYHPDGKEVAVYNPAGQKLIEVEVGYLADPAIRDRWLAQQANQPGASALPIDFTPEPDGTGYSGIDPLIFGLAVFVLIIISGGLGIYFYQKKKKGDYDSDLN